MKKVIIGMILVSGIALGFIFKMKADRKLKGKFEIVKVHECGYVDFKFTNLGTSAVFSGYGKNSPVSLVDREVEGKWLVGMGGWCGTGLNDISIDQGESIFFTQRNYHDNNKWRVALTLYQPSKYPSWIENFLVSYNIFEDVKRETFKSEEIPAHKISKVSETCKLEKHYHPKPKEISEELAED